MQYLELGGMRGHISHKALERSAGRFSIRGRGFPLTLGE